LHTYRIVTVREGNEADAGLMGISTVVGAQVGAATALEPLEPQRGQAQYQAQQESVVAWTKGMSGKVAVQVQEMRDCSPVPDSQRRSWPL